MQINKYGVYNLSTIPSSKAANWSPSKVRFEDENKSKKNLPGPGTYDQSDYSQGQYILSTFKSQGTRIY